MVNKILQIAVAENWTDSEKTQLIAQRSDLDSFAVLYYADPTWIRIAKRPLEF